MNTKTKLYVRTWDHEKHKWTPQRGVRTGPYTQFGVRRALRKLRSMGYETGRENGFSVLIESSECRE